MTNRLTNHYLNSTPSSRLPLLLLLFLPAALLLISPAEALERKDIRIGNPLKSHAVCNDYSAAAYYLNQARGAPLAQTRWVVHFEGGGGCSNFSDCNQRWLEEDGRNQILMSSMDLPTKIDGADILSEDPDKNILFHDYNHVLVPYCSSDAWLANRSNEHFRTSNGSPTQFRFNDSENADNFVYKGQAILQAVLTDLLVVGLEQATELVLVGTSAGGIGVLNNLQLIESLLPNTTITVIIDSAWFIGFSGRHVLQFSAETADALYSSHPACQDLTLGYPCCVSPACLFLRGYLDNTSSHILVLSSLYDILTLESPLLDLLQHGDGAGTTEDLALLALFNGYGSVMEESLLQSFSANSRLSVFAPSCSQHVHMATSSLWAPGGLLNASVEGVYQTSIFHLTNPVQSGNWERVMVSTAHNSSLTLLQVLSQWYSNTSQHLFLTDQCSGPACGVCPSQITIVPPLNIWPFIYQCIVLTFSALMTLIPIAIKLVAYMYMEYLLYRQKVFAYDMSYLNRKKPRFPKPTHAVNVSCAHLSYHISQVSGGEMKTPSADVSDSKQISSQQHYHTHARMQAFLPCYKRLCSKLYINWSSRNNKKRVSLNSSGSSQADLLVHSSQRPDSGISSEIERPPYTQLVKDSHKTQQSSSSTNFDTASLFSRDTGEGSRVHRSHRKVILSQVNMYINPGELVAIMGPSGSGKTTLLDVLLNKRTTGTTSGEILINGTPLSKMRRWFVGNTGYVRQLASYYYNELTVRENLLFSMNMQAMRGMSLKQKLERVEQVIREMGLQEQADVVVGDAATGLGLSGGQRKRLAIAVQLLSVPNILFLDEPTSGLDSASSLEILKSLQVLAETGRAVVVTIHQPRSEIFLAFDKILLLCKGQVAFFGSPVKVWDFFSQALEIDDELQSEGGNSSNMADRILDLLKERKKEQKVLQEYRRCGEPDKVRNAVERGKGDSEHVPLPLDSRNPGLWHRFVSLEARASLRQNVFTVIYLPIVYLVFGVILGTTYYTTNNPVQIMSVTCLLSCSSALFMSSIILSLLIEPLRLFRLEHSDGISSAHELVLQVFIRMSAVCTFPLAVCATIVFALVYQNHSIEVYFLILLAFLLVNQCWLSLFILLTVIYPQQAHRMCPVFSAVGGFCCGFIIPRPLMPFYYRWIFYINPSYYAYSSTTVTVLWDNDLGCDRDSPIECFLESNYAALQRFGLDGVNPAQSMVVLIGMVFVLLFVATLVLHLKVSISILKEKGKTLLNCISKRRSYTRVHSSDHPSSLKQLSSSSSSNGHTHNGHPPTYDSIIELETIDDTIHSNPSSTSIERPVSTDFLLNGRHSLLMRFPWERGYEAEETDYHGPTVTPPPPTTVTPHSSQLSQDGWTGGEGGGGGGIERGRRRSRRKKETVVQIVMEEEGIDEDERRKIAEQKWQQRRSEIETELRRLQHSRHNRERVRRHSDVHLVNEADEEGGLHRPRRAISSHAGINTKKMSSTRWKGQVSGRSQSNQNVAGKSSGNGKERERLRGEWRSRLGSHKEEEEEDEVDFGLPQKEVPVFEPEFGESSRPLDMSQIPMEEITMATNIDSPAPWNTGGEQDSHF